MNDSSNLEDRGRFEVRYLAFLETVTHLRPRLHRYCARMTGSVSDGEDVVQAALFEAYRALDSFDDSRPLEPWLFRIAHHRCIDFLRRRSVREQAESTAVKPAPVEPVDPPGSALDRAIEHLVFTLPPKERSCVLLKDVLDYTLEEIAGLVDSTVGGVKAALSRGRTKLASLPAAARPRRPANPQLEQLLGLYVDRFNRRDWEGLRDLVSDDARVRVADRFAGRLTDSPYFGNYERSPVPWRLAVSEVDGEPEIVVLKHAAGRWTPHSMIHLEADDGRVVRITDYGHCPWVLAAARTVVLPASTKSRRMAPNGGNVQHLDEAGGSDAAEG